MKKMFRWFWFLFNASVGIIGLIVLHAALKGDMLIIAGIALLLTYQAVIQLRNEIEKMEENP